MYKRQVLHKPIPSAPNSRATLVSIGVSEFVLTFNFLTSSAHDITLLKSPDKFGFTVETFPSITWPEPPSIVIMSPSLMVTPSYSNIFFS